MTSFFHRSLQLEKLDLTLILCFVDVTLHTLDDVLQPAANWMLKVPEVKDELETIIVEQWFSFSKNVFYHLMKMHITFVDHY